MAFADIVKNVDDASISSTLKDGETCDDSSPDLPNLPSVRKLAMKPLPPS